MVNKDFQKDDLPTTEFLLWCRAVSARSTSGVNSSGSNTAVAAYSVFSMIAAASAADNAAITTHAARCHSRCCENRRRRRYDDVRTRALNADTSDGDCRPQSQQRREPTTLRRSWRWSRVRTRPLRIPSIVRHGNWKPTNRLEADVGNGVQQTRRSDTSTGVNICDYSPLYRDRQRVVRLHQTPTIIVCRTISAEFGSDRFLC